MRAAGCAGRARVRREWLAALDSPLLSKFLEDVAAGQLQLPDFQREWKWDDDRIRSLLATLTLGYPMGVVMTLETGGDGPRFKPRPLAGVEAPRDQEPEQLLLDGQQRLTSLYQALSSDTPVDTTDSRGRKLRRWYYVDIAKAIANTDERDEAIISVPEDRVVRRDFGRDVHLDLSTQENECAAGMFPLSIVFDNRKTLRWMRQYENWDVDRESSRESFQDVLDNVTRYGVPLIRLGKETPKEAVCTVFEKVNRGGIPLDVFELVTATYVGDREYFEDHGEDFQLSEYWRKTHANIAATYPVLGDFQSTDFLQAVCLAATYERRREHLNRGRDTLFATPALGTTRMAC